MKIGLLLSLLLISSLSYSDKKYEESLTTNSQYSVQDVEKIASLWGLSKAEVIRYQDIIRGPLGQWNPKIDPVMVLGIYAENDTERKRYAEIYALQEFQLTEMTQLFQREYDKAFKRLFPGVDIIDPLLLERYYGKKSLSRKKILNATLQSGDKILYFADINCQKCRSQLAILENIITHNDTDSIAISIDVYVINAKTEDAVRQWAKHHQINVDLVSKAKITLNIDNGLQQQLNAASGQSSPVYLLRNKKTFVIKPSDIGL